MKMKLMTVLSNSDVGGDPFALCSSSKSVPVIFLLSGEIFVLLILLNIVLLQEP
jgi:hypothetical protein